VDRLEDELSKATPDAAAIEVLEEELEQAKGELERVSDVYVDVEAKKAELNEEQKINKLEMDQASKAVEELQWKLNKAQSMVQKLQGTREEHLKQKNEAIAKVDKARGLRQPWEEEVDGVKQQLEETIQDAQAICPDRVPVRDGNTAENIMNKLKRLEATRKQSEKELGGSQEELLSRANEAKKLHMDAMREFEDIKNLRNVSQIACMIMELLLTYLSNSSTLLSIERTAGCNSGTVSLFGRGSCSTIS
jgi:DNA repair exonuclease SbcCD ATPase subunit